MIDVLNFNLLEDVIAASDTTAAASYPTLPWEQKAYPVDGSARRRRDISPGN
jgi:hypothetical protein